MGKSDQMSNMRPSSKGKFSDKPNAPGGDLPYQSSLSPGPSNSLF